nr:hypothetical protein [Halobacterium salinarum]
MTCKFAHPVFDLTAFEFVPGVVDGVFGDLIERVESLTRTSRVLCCNSSTECEYAGFDGVVVECVFRVAFENRLQFGRVVG